MIAKFTKSTTWIALAICSLALAGLAIVIFPRSNPISEIEKLGGKIKRSSKPSKVGVWLSGKGWRLASSWVSRVSSRFSPVGTVVLQGKGVTDHHLVHLKDLTNLLSLNLYSTQITGAGLTNLEHLTQLGTLNLNNTQITDAGLVHLKDLRQLKTLNLESTQVTKEGHDYLLHAMPSLSNRPFL